jgi:heme/copper-type cytochrome/quinol oxidase subunit 2
MKAIFHQFESPIFRWVVAAIVLALVLLIATVAAACPTCKEGLAQNDPQGKAMAAGINYSIIFMMSMPYIVLGTFGSLAYVSIRRARQVEVATTDQPAADADAGPNS